MEENIKVNGLKIICMVKEYILGKMGENMKDNIIWTKNKELGNIDGQMEENIKEIGKMVNSTGKENII